MATIRIFTTAASGSDVNAVAVDEVGTFITGQVCSSVGWAKADMMQESGFHDWFYQRRYPGGHDLEFVETPTSDWCGRSEHDHETVLPWHLDPANNSTWRPEGFNTPVKEQP